MEMIDYNSTSDEQLVERAIAGDVEAFGEIYKRYHRAVYSFIIKSICNETIAEEVTQSTFIILQEQFSKNVKVKSIKNFTFTIATNKLFDYLRKEKKDMKNRLSRDIIIDLTEKMQNKQLSEIIKQAINNLPDKYKLPLILFFYGNNKEEEISEILKLPEGTVKTRLRRAKQVLKDMLSPIIDKYR